jgi:GGDEF domain-containing protein
LIQQYKNIHKEFIDISKNKFDAERIEHLTHYDLLTNLPNRVLLYDRIRHAITVAEREKKQLAVLMLD